MTVERYVRKETRTDYVGTYTAYIYADGHVETDPPDRPQYREDVQRQRRKEVALARARRMLEIERSRAGIRGRPVPNAVVRESDALVSGRALNESFHATLHAFAQVAQTVSIAEVYTDQLIENFDLGGPLVGENAGTQPEYGYATGERGEEGDGVREERYPLEGR